MKTEEYRPAENVEICEDGIHKKQENKKWLNDKAKMK